MRLSHLHIAFKDFAAARAWLADVLGLQPVEESAAHAVYRLDGAELVIHPDWGEGDSPLTIAFASTDCARDYAAALARGARARTPPRDKGPSINADVHGPGRLVVEFEQLVAAAATPAA